MNIEHLHIGMPVFVAKFEPERGTITVYRGTVVALNTGHDKSVGGAVTVWGEDSAKVPVGITCDSSWIEQTPMDAIESLYVRTMLQLRVFSEATRKAEWLYRFSQLNKGDMRFNAEIPVHGQEEEDERAMDAIVQRLASEKVAQCPVVFPVTKAKGEETEVIANEDGDDDPPNDDGRFERGCC